MKQDNNRMDKIDRAWDRMNVLLDEKMPRRKRRYGFLIWLFGFAALIGFIGLGQLASGTQSSEGLAKLDSGMPQQDLEKDLKEELTPPAEQLIHENDIESKQGRDTSNEEKASDVRDSSKNHITPSRASATGTGTIKQSEGKVRSMDSGPLTIEEKRFTAERFVRMPESAQDRMEMTVPAYRSETRTALLPLVVQNRLYRNTEPVQLGNERLATMLEKEVLVQAQESKWQFSAGVFGEYIPDFSSAGFGLGLQAEKRFSARWSAGVRFGYMINNRSFSESRALQELDGLNSEDVPVTPGGQVTVDEETRTILQKNFTDTLNSLGLEAFISYRPAKKLGIQTGFAVERYTGQLNLMGEFSNGQSGLFGMNNYELESRTAYISYVTAAIAYDLPFSLSLHLGYRMALNEFYGASNYTVNTSKFTGGLTYRF